MASKIILFKNFNNYYNRIIKKYNTVQSYISDSSDYAIRGTANSANPVAGGYGPVNFNINDGITAEMTYNYADNQDWDPDYIIVCDDFSSLDSAIIQYRFFVMEAVRTRRGQYRLLLKRDIVGDHLENVINQPVFLERGPLNFNDSPFIFNKEPIEFNQIKTSETLLKDRTQCPWIIGFVAKNQPEGVKSSYGGVEVSSTVYGSYDETYSSMANYPYWDYLATSDDDDNKFWAVNVGCGICITIFVNYTPTNVPAVCLGITYQWDQYSGFQYLNFRRITNTGNLMTEYVSSPFFYNGTALENDANAESFGRTLAAVLNSSTTLPDKLRDYAVAAGNNVHTQAELNALLQEGGKIIKTNSNSIAHPTTGQVYNAGKYVIGRSYYQSDMMVGRVSDYEGPTQYVYKEYFNGVNYTSNRLSKTSTAQQEIFNTLSHYTNALNITVSGTYQDRWIANVCIFGIGALLKAENANTSAVTFTTNNNNKSLADAPYRMFAIPYNDNNVRWKRATSTYTTSKKNINMSVAQGFSQTFSGTWLYDLQLVPFCPFVNSDRISISGDEVTIDIEGLTENTDYTKVNLVVGADSYVESIILWCDISQVDNYHITYNIPTASTAVERKVNNQCDIYRLSSPSYNSIYEFNAERNGGVTYFDMDLVYKPYDSYIHINPNFGILYGSDFNDSRGLIFTGPFSLPQTTSAWMQYRLNNMNYQNSFDRQIQNMDTMHDYDMIEKKWKVATGAVQGAVSGAAAGAVGGGFGALAGAAIGAGMSIGAGLKDLELAEDRFKESKNFATDEFNYNLQNVKAQAQAISKVSAFTPNNKIFPVLEYYTCTEAEKTAFRDKLKYNGMTIGVIGKIRDYLQSDYSFFRVKLIRFEDGAMDFHNMSDLAEELDKGVFIKQ